MSFRRMIGVVFLIVGVLCLAASYYIKGRVEEGKLQVASAQEKVDVGKGALSMDERTKLAGDIIAAPIEKKIDKGRLDIATYETIANYLQIVGIIFVVLGAFLLFLFRRG